MNLLIYFIITLGKFTTNKISSEMLPTFWVKKKLFIAPAKILGSGGIRTRAFEKTGALNQRLRPLGHATFLLGVEFCKVQFRRFGHLKFFKKGDKSRIFPGSYIIKGFDHINR